MNPRNFEDRVDPTDGKDAVLLGTVVEETPMEATRVHEAPLEEMTSSNAPEMDMSTHPDVIETKAAVVPLLEHEESEHFRTLWNEIQGRFVDEPRSAVQQADTLVSDVIERITHMFADEHSSLEQQWKEGKDVSTEDLRQALQHYRSFFNRLVV